MLTVNAFCGTFQQEFTTRFLMEVEGVLSVAAKYFIDAAVS